MAWSILAADIGGTNSRFGFFSDEGGHGLSLVRSHWIATENASSFDHLLQLLGQSDFPLKPVEADIAVFAVAGPVERAAYSAPPLIPWDIDISKAAYVRGLRRPVVLINDFVAQAYACRSPLASSAKEILPGEADPSGTVAVLGAGTGLGKACLAADGSGGFIAVPSEGGHASFPFVSDAECRLQDFFMKELQLDYATANHVVSGTGLSVIHHFLTGRKLTPEEVAGGFTDGSETLEWFSRFYGRLCRNFGLDVLSTGGMYVAGGIAAKAPEVLTHAAFAAEFRSSATMGRILGRMPVSLITNQESGLWGAALLGRQVLVRG